MKSIQIIAMERKTHYYIDGGDRTVEANEAREYLQDYNTLHLWSARFTTVGIGSHTVLTQFALTGTAHKPAYDQTTQLALLGKYPNGEAWRALDAHLKMADVCSR